MKLVNQMLRKILWNDEGDNVGTFVWYHLYELSKDNE